MKTFGQLIKELREEKGWMLQELAGWIGKSIAYVSQIERDNSPTIASEETAERIIDAFRKHAKIDELTVKKLEKAYRRDLKTHVVERIFPSSTLLEQFFADTRLSVGAVASRMTDETGRPRSRQIVQVWKNGVQMPTHEAAQDLARVFVNAGITSSRVDDYLKMHLFDSVFASRDIAHFSAAQKQSVADCAVQAFFGAPMSAKASV